MEKIASAKCFAGDQQRLRHYSEINKCEMFFSVYLPPMAQNKKVPLLYWLSGLTCNDQNFVTKSGFQKYAAQYGIAIVAPDTSPRGENIPDNPEWNLGQGAGFYLNATELPWANHYQMESYLVDELFELVANHFPVDTKRCGIFGHSMGGHGAITLAFNHPDRYHTLSTFAPICCPTQSPWGQKALTHYLGSNRDLWSRYDACELIKKYHWDSNILIDQGLDDEFLLTELHTHQFEEVAKINQRNLTFRYWPGYDHGYYFIATFIEDHIKHHSQIFNFM